MLRECRSIVYISDCVSFTYAVMRVHESDNRLGELVMSVINRTFVMEPYS